LTQIHDPATARQIAAIREKRAAELRGLAAELGPESAALVVRLLLLSRAGKIEGIWIRRCGVRVRLPWMMEMTTPTIMWGRLKRWIERLEANCAE
jgi:hypothetical protein